MMGEPSEDSDASAVLLLADRAVRCSSVPSRLQTTCSRQRAAAPVHAVDDEELCVDRVERGRCRASARGARRDVDLGAARPVERAPEHDGCMGGEVFDHVELGGGRVDDELPDTGERPWRLARRDVGDDGVVVDGCHGDGRRVHHLRRSRCTREGTSRSWVTAFRTGAGTTPDHPSSQCRRWASSRSSRSRSTRSRRCRRRGRSRRWQGSPTRRPRPSLVGGRRRRTRSPSVRAPAQRPLRLRAARRSLRPRRTLRAGARRHEDEKRAVLQRVRLSPPGYQ